MDIVKVFGNNLKKYRTRTGFSQEAFAEKCGMHRTYISAIECYRRSISLENNAYFLDYEGTRRPIQIILLAIKCLFMEQDCAYWNYSGRKMLFEGLANRQLV